ncbi:cryptic plasmid protein A, partial [Salmonella enterica subsp. enterica serovar Senftenberg]
ARQKLAGLRRMLDGKAVKTSQDL